MKTKHLLIVMLLIAGNYSLYAWDFEQVWIEDFYYNLDATDQTAELCGRTYDWDEYTTSLIIPNTVSYDQIEYRVTSIAEDAFRSTHLTSVTFGEELQHIGNYAFFDTYLESVVWNVKNFPELSYEYGDSSPFYSSRTSLTSFKFGDKVESIPDLICSNLINLSTITIPNNVVYIGSHAFANCSGLTSVTIGNGVTDIGRYSFSGCTNLSTVVLGNSVVNIEEFAFAECAIINISFPNSVRKIGYAAFYGCSSLTSVEIPNSIISIGDNAFDNCKALMYPVYNAHIFARLPYAYEGAYSIMDGIETIAGGAFSDCEKLLNINIPNSITSIGYNAFFRCKGLKSIHIPNSVKSIDNYAFENCTGLTSLELPSSLTYLYGSIFYGCNNLISIKIPSSILSYGEYAIAHKDEMQEWEDKYASYRTTIAGDIDDYDYYLDMYHIRYSNMMPNLQTVEAPAWFFDVPEVNWTICPKYLENVTVNRGEMNDNVFGVIKRSYKTLRSFDVSGVSNTTLADEAFKEFYNLQALALPSNLEYIGYKAAAECVKLKAIDIPASVTEIGDRAFEDCRSLQTITFGGVQPASAPARSAAAAQTTSQLRRIGNWAFYNAHELQHLEIPEGVEEIGDAAFYGCTYLVDLVLPASVRSIGDNCFALCSKLGKIVVNSPEPPEIQAKTFYDVKRRIPVYVPDESVDTYKDNSLWGEFDIQGISNLDDAIENIGLDPSVAPVKIFYGGQLLILRDGKTYTLQGQQLK